MSTDYKNTKSPLKFVCGCGELFQTSFEKFKSRNKRTCNKCSYKKIAINESYTYEEVKSYIEKNSECKLISYSYKNCFEPLLLMCHCQNKFSLSFHAFKTRKGKQCDHCNNLFSYGEKTVADLLRKYNIKFIEQFSFEDLKAGNGKHFLRFDFAIINKNNGIDTLIEYDGKQHFTPIEYFGGEKAFRRLKLNDRKKDEYCKNNGIRLVRIPYYKDIKETLINEKIITHKIIA